jgi:hypothetical protein
MVENASISGAVLSARDRKKSSEAAIVQGESRVQARVRWLAAIDQQVGVVEHAPLEAETGESQTSGGSTAQCWTTALEKHACT